MFQIGDLSLFLAGLRDDLHPAQRCVCFMVGL